MRKKYKTEQEMFWAGDFGDNYIERNMDPELLANKIKLWGDILHGGEKIDSCLEFGANIGMNLVALGILFPMLKMYGVEINQKAFEECDKLDRVTAFNESILDFETDLMFDLVFTSGVLIHINPDELPSIYDKMYNLSNKYIVVAEYYNPSPLEIKYRGNDGKMFKRDFAGELMDRYPDLRLINYGFVYHRDKTFPLDDITWFLLQK